MYIIEKTNEKVTSYMKAIEIANSLNSNVIDENTGFVKWQPAPAVSSEKMQRYNERLSARKAYEKIIKK